MGVWALSVGVLLLEVSLTRVLSAVTWYHFAFLVISAALLGFGASGLVVYLLPRRRTENALRWQLGLSGLGFVVSVFLLLPLLEEYDPNIVSVGVGQMVRTLGVGLVVAAAPFFFAGLCLALVFASFPRESGALYGSDLLGAAAGCVLAIVALGRLGGVGAVVSAGVFVGVAVVCFGVGGRRVLLPGLGVVGVLASVVLVWRAPKVITLATGSPIPVEEDLWNSFSRLTVKQGVGAGGFAWGASPRYPASLRPVKAIIIDGKAWTVVERFEGDLREAEYLKLDVTAFAHFLRSGGKVGIIGPGGGRDVLTALVFGRREVVGVEVNPLIVDLVRRRYGDYAGHLYDWPGVRIVVDDARSYFERSKERFEVIQASLVDTWAASSSAAFALTENNLYTVEAFRAYIRHLSEGGILSVSRWHAPVGPRESLRLFGLALQALREEGVEDGGRHIVVVASPLSTAHSTGAPVANLLLKRVPFTEEEVGTVLARAGEMGFEPVYVPGAGGEPLFMEVAGSDNLYRDCADIHGLDYRPPRDDRPFFFLFARLSRLLRPVGQTLWEHTEVRPLRLLVGLLLVVAVLVTLFIVAPLAAFARRPWAHAARSSHLLLYFAAIGVGFMMVEMSLMQRFILLLGHPVYSLSVILFSLLGFGGIGSLLTNRVGEEGARRRAGLALGGATALLVVYLVVLPLAVGRALGLGTGLRVGVAVGLLCPLALLIGMPLPLGMKLASRRDPNLIPWLWGINGATSVLGSVLAVVVAVAAGFTASLSVGAACYLAAALLVATSAPAPVTVRPGAPLGRADRPRPVKSAKKTRKR